MGLQVWLPLNGSLENRGLSNTTLGGTYSPTYIDGKIGKCMNCSTTVKLTPSTPMKSTKYSFAAWIKSAIVTSSSTVWWKIFRMNYSDSTYHTLYTADSGSGRYKMEYNPEYNVYCDTQVWQHLVFTIDGAKITAYLNGTLVGSSTGSNAERTLSSIEVGGNANVWLNDVRVYDHILSPKEVKEISKALCLHYTLNNNGCGQENLVKGNYSVIATATSKTSTGSATITLPTGYTSWNQLIGKTVTLSYEYAIEGARLNNTGTYSKDRFGIHGTVTGTNSAGSAVTHYPFASYLEVSGRGKAVQTFTFPTSMTTVTGFTLALQAYNQPAANSPDTWYIKNVKLELGDKATAFVLHKEDAGYGAMGVDKEYDTSGYRNNATPIDSTITHLYGSPRYDVYTKFDGNTSGLKIENTAQISPVLNNGIFTISFWVKHDVASNREIYFGNFDATADFNLERTAGNDLRFYWNASPDLTMSGTTISDANWHHVVVTRNGSAVKCYIDGVSKYSGTATIASLTFDGSFRLGRDTRTGTTAFGGGMSDFRLYATALSDSDILELYNAPAAVDNDGNMYAMQLVEVI